MRIDALVKIGAGHANLEQSRADSVLPVEEGVGAHSHDVQGAVDLADLQSHGYSAP